MSVMLLARRYLQEYTRRPINLILLVAVPVIFVLLTAGAIADFATIVGAVDDPGRLAAPTAGWAAAFLAGVAGFFHVLGSRDADRRLAASGIGPTRVVVGRVASGLVLAFLAAGAALGALAIRSDVSDPGAAVAGTFMFAAVYFAIGVGVGAVVHNDVNGSLVVVFIWMLDVFLGPAMAGGDVWITRLFPSHFITLVMLDAGSAHGGWISDTGWAMVWTIGAMLLAGLIFGVSTANTVARRNRRRSS